MDTPDHQSHQTSSRSAGNSTEGVEHLLALRKYDSALALCRELLQHDQDSSELHQLAGVAALAMEDYDNAKLHLEISLQQNPEEVETLFHLSRYWSAKKRPRKAESTIKRAIALFPYEPGFWSHLAWVYYQEGAYARAREPAEKALTMAPDDPNVGNVHAAVMAECEGGTKLDLHAQEARLLEILSIDPESHAVQHNTGLFYLSEMGDHEKAAQHLSTAASLDPTSQTTRSLLARALRRLDPFLKWLYFPHQITFAFKTFQRKAAQNQWGYVSLIAISGLLLLPLIIGLAFWAIGVWPLAKAYEFLTVSELRERMKVNGHPGPLHIHQWPRWVRLLALGSIYALFWFCLLAFWGSTPVKVFLSLAISFVMMELCGLSLKQQFTQIRDDWRNR
ncbi:MAG: tetratricopeptide repeat protein [Verrucomicrobiaceae bacterium]|nr:tetratricopeptide repeat protein [Verrucomicrobiaceae bacterium]